MRLEENCVVTGQLKRWALNLEKVKNKDKKHDEVSLKHIQVKIMIKR